MAFGVNLRALLAAAGIGGAAGPWDVIDSTTLGSAAASISFATGLSGYKLFRVTAYIVKDGTSGDVQLRLNNDSGTNYAYQDVVGTGTSVSPLRTTGASRIGLTQGSAVGANESMTLEAVIAKQIAGSAAMVLTSQAFSSVGPIIKFEGLGGIWSNTADLISRIDLISSSGNFAAGTTVVLEGIPD